ncbi:hypothetical protein ABT330_21750 [Streptomyces sp. NPDC000658]|uniref:hypothetical protein n=1 Tax=Streptomyces sp. NPDC000658 TaxID=3154266 RepID=UPI003325E6CF
MSSSTLPPAFGARLGATALTVLAAAGFTCLAAPTAVAVGEAGDIRIHREQVPPGVSKDDPVACRFYLDAANFGELPTVGYTIKARPPAPDTATVTGTITLTDGAGHTDILGLAEGSYTLEWTLPAAAPGAPPAPSPKVKVFKISCPEGQRGGNEGPNRPITDDGREVAAPNGQNGNGQGGNGRGGNGQGENGQSGNGQSGNGQGGNGWSGEKGGGPAGGVHAGGGGLADTSHSFTPLAGAAAVGLVAVGGVAYFRLTRRRNHGAA